MARICVIGAGPSGLVTIKELLDEGHEVVCYDKQSEVGGLFVYGGEKNGVYKNTFLTISNYFMAFSDFPPKENERIHWHHEQYLAYLNDYVKHFNLQHCIECNTEVLLMEKQGDKWEITTQNNSISETQKQQFDGVAICSGTHQIPNIPAIEGADSFDGKLVHASEYKDNTPFEGKNVVVVGIGESSADIVREIAQKANSCHLVMRSYPTVSPRNLDYDSADSRTARVGSHLSYPSNFLIKLYVVFVTFFAVSFSAIKRALGLGKKLERDSFYQSVDNHFMDHGTPFTEEAIRIIKVWMLLGKTQMQNKFITKNATFVNDIVAGKIQVSLGELAKITPKNLQLENGKVIPCDTIVFCTGYVDRFAFLKDYSIKDNNVRNLFMHAFHPEMDNVAFIGWSRPSAGGVPACSEMVARYFALLISKKKKLPSNMEALIASNKAEADERFKYNKNVLTLVDYNDFMARMSKLIGCEVKWSRYFLKPTLLYKMTFGSHLSCQYRLFGPHQNRLESEKIIKRLPVNPMFLNPLIATAGTIGYFLNIRVAERISAEHQVKGFLPKINITDDHIKKYAFKPES